VFHFFSDKPNFVIIEVEHDPIVAFTVFATNNITPSVILRTNRSRFRGFRYKTISPL
jgi:hypothetical protein